MELQLDPRQPSKKSINSSQSSRSSNSLQNIHSTNDNSFGFQVPPLSSQQSYAQYLHFFLDIASDTRELSSILHELQQCGIFFNPNYDKKFFKVHSDYHFKINSVKPTKHYQIVQTNVSLGPFSHTLLLYNTFQQAILTKLKSPNCTRRAQIVKTVLNHKKIVAKSFHLSIDEEKKLNRYQNFVNAVKEYFIAKIMSILKIGPKLCTELCFDMFVSLTQISFFIEQCEEITRTFTEKDIHQLKISLREMHLLQILHRDIKPDNVMYSPSYRKCVLIDFGVSDYRAEKPNELSFTCFAGTFAYCSDEVKRLFEMRESQWVNLYLNDVCGLKITISSAKKNYPSWYDELEYKKKIEKGYDFKNDNFLQEVGIKYSFFSGEERKLSEIGSNLVPQLLHIIMTFLYEVRIGQKVRKMYHDYLELGVKQLQGYEDLKQILSNKIFFESCKGRRNFYDQKILDKKGLYERFYETIENENYHKLNDRVYKLSELSAVLFDKEIDLLEFSRYERFLIEYISFRRVENAVPLEKKIMVCQHYLRLHKVVHEEQIQKLSQEKTIFLVVDHILTNMPASKKVQNFRMFQQAIQIYNLITIYVEMKVLLQIQEVVLGIDMCEEFSYVLKTQNLLKTIQILGILTSPYCKTEVYNKTIEIKELIIKLILSYDGKPKPPIQQSLYKIYLSSINVFYPEYENQNQERPSEILQKIDSIKPEMHKMTKHLLEMIQDKLLAKVQKASNVNFHKRQAEQALQEQMQRSKQLATNLYDMISYLTTTKQIKKLKRYLSLFDSCLQIEPIYSKYYIHSRIVVLLNDETEPEESKQQKISNLCTKMQLNYQFNKEGILPFVTYIQSYFALYSNFQTSSHYLQSFMDIQPKIIQAIPKFIQIYENQNVSLIYRRSKNLIYLQLLQRNLETQFQAILRSNNIEKYSYQAKCKIYPKISTFHKILNIDRSNFIQKDHIFLLFYDIIWIRHEKDKQANAQVLNYLVSRRKLIKKFYVLENTRQKVFIIETFRMALYFFDDQTNWKLMKQGFDFVYQIVGQKIILDEFSVNFNKEVTKFLVKLQRWDQILKIALNASKSYADDLSHSSVIFFSKFCSWLIDEISHSPYENLFYNELNTFMAQLNFKKTPDFGIFLLQCIKPFNRKAIIKHLIQCLQSVKFHGKNFIFSSYYKELLKLEEFSFVSKKRFLMKKDVRYPSKSLKTLEEMKSELNYQGKILYFFGVFKAKLEKKIISLGNICEVIHVKK